MEKEGFIDILASRRGTSDLRWSAKEWNPTVDYKHGHRLKREEIFDRVLKSDRVKQEIQKLCREGRTKHSVESEVKKILEQMGHKQDISYIRYFAFILSKLMKQLYTHIFVNTSGLEKVKDVYSETPTIFLPSHRSYADFLLVSYVCFYFDFPIPIIAAGMDFIHMAIIGEMFRGSGAFFIRRSFVYDSLYCAVFQEYVQNLVMNSGSPFEFFLEGTRSRNGKSLSPKLGLLGCVISCWFRGLLPDLQFVPISLSYNRTLEEELYAYELLGVPKPRESTSELLKASRILKENYGNIYVNFGEPISARKFLEPVVKRFLFTDRPL